MNLGTEAVITVVPGTDIRAERYTALNKIPLLQRPRARQLGAAGFWYLPVGDTMGIAFDKLSDAFWKKADAAATVISEDLGLGHGVLGVFSKVFGLPYWLSVVLVVFIGYALLRGANLVPPVTAVVKP